MSGCVLSSADRPSGAQHAGRTGEPLLRLPSRRSRLRLACKASPSASTPGCRCSESIHSPSSLDPPCCRCRYRCSCSCYRSFSLLLQLVQVVENMQPLNPANRRLSPAAPAPRRRIALTAACAIHTPTHASYATSSGRWRVAASQPSDALTQSEES